LGVTKFMTVIAMNLVTTSRLNLFVRMCKFDL
jgi:hypothetical protein